MLCGGQAASEARLLRSDQRALTMRTGVKSSCEQLLFEDIGITQRPQFAAPHGLIRDSEMVPAEHIEILAGQRREPGYIFGFHDHPLGAEMG